MDGMKQKAALAPAGNTRAGGSEEFDGNWDVTLNCTTTGKAEGFKGVPCPPPLRAACFTPEARAQGSVSRLEVVGQIRRMARRH